MAGFSVNLWCFVTFPDGQAPKQKYLYYTEKKVKAKVRKLLKDRGVKGLVPIVMEHAFGYKKRCNVRVS